MLLRTPWLVVFVGRDWMTEDGVVAEFWLIPRRDLMTRKEEGQQILTGLHVRLRLRTPWWPRACPWVDGKIWWRHPVTLEVRSDAEEIATRLAS